MSVRTQVQLHLTRLVWTFILLIGTCFGLRAVYTVFIPLSFQTAAFAIIHIFCLQHSSEYILYNFIVATAIVCIILLLLM